MYKTQVFDLQPTCRALTLLVHARFIAEGARKRSNLKFSSSSPDLFLAKPLLVSRRDNRIEVRAILPHPP